MATESIELTKQVIEEAIKQSTEVIIEQAIEQTMEQAIGRQDFVLINFSVTASLSDSIVQ